MTDRDTITLPREVVEKAVKAFENGCPPTCENGMIDSGGFHPWGQPALVPCPACLAFEHLRTALAAEQPSEDIEALRRENERLREALESIAAELRHLHAENERLMTRLVEAKDKALRYDLDAAGISNREKEALELVELRAENERLREALKLALNSHGRMLMSDPPQDAWKFNRVDEVIAAALRREEAKP